MIELFGRELGELAAVLLRHRFDDLRLDVMDGATAEATCGAVGAGRVGRG